MRQLLPFYHVSTRRGGEQVVMATPPFFSEASGVAATQIHTWSDVGTIWSEEHAWWFQ